MVPNSTAVENIKIRTLELDLNPLPPTKTFSLFLIISVLTSVRGAACPEA
jgi:hypothetical protein